MRKEISLFYGGPEVQNRSANHLTLKQNKDHIGKYKSKTNNTKNITF